MSQSQAMNGLTPHLFAAAMATIVVASPSPTEIYQTFFPEQSIPRSSLYERASPSDFAGIGLEANTLYGALRFCKSALEQGHSSYAEECKTVILDAKAKLADPKKPEVTAHLSEMVEITQIMYCRVAWAQAVQNPFVTFETDTCLNDLPKLASDDL